MACTIETNPVILEYIEAMGWKVQWLETVGCYAINIREPSEQESFRELLKHYE